MSDFFHRIAPTGEELEAMIRVGAFDEFGETRTRQFWQAEHLLKTYGASAKPNQGWLIPPLGLEHLAGIPLNEPTCRECLEAETDLFGFAVSGHPLELFADVAWDTYCPVARLGEHVGEEVVTCGLVVEQRVHHQITGEPMKFLTLADWTGMVETELFRRPTRATAWPLCATRCSKSRLRWSRSRTDGDFRCECKGQGGLVHIHFTSCVSVLQNCDRRTEPAPTIGSFVSRLPVGNPFDQFMYVECVHPPRPLPTGYQSAITFLSLFCP
jgi:DNA polymerase III alpha subunit